MGRHNFWPQIFHNSRAFQTSPFQAPRAVRTRNLRLHRATRNQRSGATRSCTRPVCTRNAQPNLQTSVDFTRSRSRLFVEPAVNREREVTLDFTRPKGRGCSDDCGQYESDAPFFSRHGSRRAVPTRNSQGRTCWTTHSDLLLTILPPSSSDARRLSPSSSDARRLSQFLRAPRRTSPTRKTPGSIPGGPTKAHARACVLVGPAPLDGDVPHQNDLRFLHSGARKIFLRVHSIRAHTHSEIAHLAEHQLDTLKAAGATPAF